MVALGDGRHFLIKAGKIEGRGERQRCQSGIWRGRRATEEKPRRREGGEGEGICSEGDRMGGEVEVGESNKG